MNRCTGAEDRDADRGTLTVVVALVVTICLAGGALIVDGGRALAARRHAAGVAESAARSAIGSQRIAIASGPGGADGAEIDVASLRAEAFDAAARAGVDPADVRVEVEVTDGVPTVVVTITERTPAVFLAIGGASDLIVHATGRARFVYST